MDSGRLWELGLLTLRSFVSIRGECSDVDQASNATIGSGSRDDASTVGEANQEGRANDPTQRAFYRCDVNPQIGLWNVIRVVPRKESPVTC